MFPTVTRRSNASESITSRYKIKNLGRGVCGGGVSLTGARWKGHKSRPVWKIICGPLFSRLPGQPNRDPFRWLRRNFKIYWFPNPNLFNDFVNTKKEKENREVVLEAVFSCSNSINNLLTLWKNKIGFLCNDKESKDPRN